LAVAEENLALGEERAGVACFHAQQAVEKALKAALIFSGIAPPRSHSLDALRSLLAADWELRSSAFDLSALSAWAVTSRYPDEEPDPTIADAMAAVQDADQAVASLRGELERRGFS
jgi:HEPN domain-containing protein